MFTMLIHLILSFWQADFNQKQASLVKVYSERQNNFIKAEMKKLNPGTNMK